MTPVAGAAIAHNNGRDGAVAARPDFDPVTNDSKCAGLGVHTLLLHHVPCHATLLWKGHWDNALPACGEQPRHLSFEGGDELLDGHQDGGRTAALLEFNPASLE